MDEDAYLRQSLLKDSELHNGTSGSGPASGAESTNDAEEESFDTFETVAFSAPISGRPTSGPSSTRFGAMGTLPGLGERTASGGIARLGGPVQASSSNQACSSPLGRLGAGNKFGRSATYCTSQATALNRDDAAHDDIVMAYKKKYAKMDMKHVSFMTRFRNTAQQMHHDPAARVDSSTVIRIDGGGDALSETGSPLKKNAPAAYADSVKSDSSQQQQMLHGTFLSSFVDVRTKASLLKNKDKQAGNIAMARLIFKVLFTSAAAIAAIAVGVHDLYHKGAGFTRLWGVPWISWLILATLFWPNVHIADYAMDAVVKGFELAATQLHLDNVHYTLIGLSSALKLVASALLLELLVLFIMSEHDPNDKRDDSALRFVNRTSLCFVVFAFVDLAKTLGCRLLSLRVNAESLFDLLKTTIQKETILNKLMTKARAITQRSAGNLTGGVTAAERLELIAKMRDIPEWSVEQYLDSLYALSLPVECNAVASFTDRITDIVVQFRDMPEPQLDEHATCAAEFCWLTVSPAAGKSPDRMCVDDLLAVLQNEQEAEFAFSLFDLDEDGYVTEPEVHSRILAMYRERRNLARTLQDNDDVIKTLEMLIGIVMHVFAILPYLLIFHVQVGPILFSLSSVSVAGAFVFGNSLKTVYESVVFLFVIRPYQVGDVILYKGANHVVKNFGLLSTQVMKFDGHLIWVPNQTLMSSDIANISHSQNIVDRLTFEVDVPVMRPELCQDLAERVMEMIVREEPRRLFNCDFTPASYIMGVSNPLKYMVGLTYQLAFNGEKFLKVVEARTLVNHVIGEWLVDHKLSHSTSIQPMYNIRAPGADSKFSGKSV